MLNICLWFITTYLLAFMGTKQSLIGSNPGKCKYIYSPVTILPWPCAPDSFNVSAIESWQTSSGTSQNVGDPLILCIKTLGGAC